MLFTLHSGVECAEVYSTLKTCQYDAKRAVFRFKKGPYAVRHHSTASARHWKGIMRSQSSSSHRPAQRGWLEPWSISIREHGSSNVLVLAPHGHPADDRNTELVAYHLAESLDCRASINNGKYRRATDPHDPTHVSTDLNNPDQARSHGKDWWFPILKLVDEIHRQFGAPALVAAIHGMRDKTAKAAGGPRCRFIVGVGYEKSPYRAERATVCPETRDGLIEGFTRAGYEAVDGTPGFAATKTIVPALFDEVRAPLEAFQLEIAWKGMRDTPENAEKTAEMTARVIRRFGVFRTV